ncbi:MAG TPA: hypothetical protein VG293_06380 [Solirubrobacteraceae bacterium]|nr:hypothetical protein [Solirubrobacteraceae bacterium]
MRLLLGAIRSLPEADQDAVLALLLRGLTGNDTWEHAIRLSDARCRGEVAVRGTMDLRVGGLLASERELLPTPDVKIVPIRFPQARYDELKAWCEQHNFPMAAVVRGLVERFLESQGLP